MDILRENGKGILIRVLIGIGREENYTDRSVYFKLQAVIASEQLRNSRNYRIYIFVRYNFKLTSFR